MKFKLYVVAAITIALSLACEPRTLNNSQRTANRASAPVLTQSVTPAPTPKDGDYPGTGVVTKIDMNLGSVEMNHEAIKDLMPAMTMEFFVSDKTMLDGLKLGDKIDFVIRYKDRNETIVKITKTK